MIFKTLELISKAEVKLKESKTDDYFVNYTNVKYDPTSKQLIVPLLFYTDGSFQDTLALDLDIENFDFKESLRDELIQIALSDSTDLNQKSQVLLCLTLFILNNKDLTTGMKKEVADLVVSPSLQIKYLTGFSDEKIKALFGELSNHDFDPDIEDWNNYISLTFDDQKITVLKQDSSGFSLSEIKG